MKGLIVKGIGGFYYVRTESGVIEAKGRGIFKKDGLILCVGDEVDISILPEDDSKGVIENADFEDERILCAVFFGITYESDAERALALLREEVLTLPGYRDCRTETERTEGKPEVTARVSEFLDSAVQLRVAFWVENTDASFQRKSDLYLAVKRRFEAEGIELAYPHLVVERKQST